ncbi:hypothetical protein TIFTF001_035200 [Ficus carica]|uniref:Transposase n=1 Tax=Ficus carica TaxID=3494 RepID=A0AA88E1V4_FICCA|nr:hypothetical protein TIFTF001_035200 [Ficus carica]
MSQEKEDVSTTSQIGKPLRTNTPRFNPNKDGKRRATLMRRVHLVRKRGERVQVSFDAKGQPIEKEGDELQSWIGVLAREHISIWIADFRSADLAPRKERVWVEVITSFTMELSFKKPAHHAQSPQKMLDMIFTKDDWERFITYRHSPEFKKLSEQGCEIRKKNKYGSTGGQTDIGNLIKNSYMTGQWQPQHTVWLDMHVKASGEYKNPSFRIVGEMIGDFREQLTQGSFESQWHYFNIMQSSRENAEASAMKRHLAALERTVQELCEKHGINRETMTEENTAPTVDQHNSFKASCTQNEKEPGPSV